MNFGMNSNNTKIILVWNGLLSPSSWPWSIMYGLIPSWQMRHTDCDSSHTVYILRLIQFCFSILVFQVMNPTDFWKTRPIFRDRFLENSSIFGNGHRSKFIKYFYIPNYRFGCRFYPKTTYVYPKALESAIGWVFQESVCLVSQNS